MKDNLIIDEKVCTKHKMTLQEVLLVLSIRAGDFDKCLDNLLKREVLVEVDNQYKVTQRWNEVVEDILCDSSHYISEDRLLALAAKIQEVFPSGYHQRDNRGPKYYFKSGKKDIAQALKRFIVYYGDRSDEDIVNAAKKYVADCRGDYRSIKCANYFVFKDERRNEGNITSKLNEILENADGDKETKSSNEWTSKMI